MPTNQVQLRRGTASQCNAMVPVEGEVVVDTTNDRLRLGDGSLAGGIIIPNAYDSQLQPFINGTVGGSANAITITLSPALTSYTNFQTVRFRATATNTGSATINIDGNGALTIKKIINGALVVLDASDIVGGGIYEGVVNNGEFQLLTLIESGLISVSQGDLNTSTGTVTIDSGILDGNVADGFYTLGRFTGSSASVTFTTYIGRGRYISGSSATINLVSTVLPGGEYGFYPQLNRTRINSTNNTINAKQRYVTSSPPYDLGDGEVAGFFFALVDNEGNIKSHYLADTPPWAYNGPTNIKATHKCRVTGKKYRKVIRKRTFEQLMDESTPVQYELEEITQSIKNKDMNIIPQPFGGDLNGLTPVLLDPMDEKIRKMVEYQNIGGSDEIVEAIIGGKFIIDNTLSKRKGPQGVAIHKMKYKFAKRF